MPDRDAAAESQVESFRRECLSILHETTRLLEGSDALRLMQQVAERARTTARADFAALATFSEAGLMERFIYAGMPDELARRLGSPPVGRGLLGVLANRSEPMRVDDLQAHAAFTGWPGEHPDMVAFLGVPVRAGGRTIGSLYMTRVRGRPPFDENDEFVATLLAMQVALSISAALAQQRYGRVSLLEERVRIAHDLHDGTIQSLYALGLDFDTAVQRRAVEGEARALLELGVDRINQVIADIRQYIAMLEAVTPVGEPDLARDLPFAVRQLVPAGVDVVLNITAPALQRFSARDTEDLLFIAREALSNAARHAEPTRIAVDLRQGAAETALTIQDNGIGFDPATVHRGLGTTTMHTRAERLNAALTILSIPGMGTTVRVAIPTFPEDGEDGQ